MESVLAIGDFSRATHLSIKTLRYYHEIGLLVPAAVDESSGYRRHRAEQIRSAQVIRRFRDLDMPLREIAAALDAPDIETRNDLIAAHLDRLEASLDRTQRSVASLRDLLSPRGAGHAIEHRRLDATPVAAITEVVSVSDALSWWQGALGEPDGTLAAERLEAAGPPGGLYAIELFSEAQGVATIYVPCAGRIREMGRVRAHVLPAVELATTRHTGSHRDIDLAYGALASHVSEHAIGIDGAIRETYLVSPHETTDEAVWLTEVGWPVFATR